MIKIAIILGIALSNIVGVVIGFVLGANYYEGMLRRITNLGKDNEQ